YVCLHRTTGRIVESRDIVFDEGDPQGPSRVKIDTSPLEKQTAAAKHDTNDIQGLEAPPKPITSDDDPDDDAPEVGNPAAESPHDDDEQPAPISIVKFQPENPSQEVLAPNNTRTLETDRVQLPISSAARQPGPPNPYPRPAPPPEVRRAPMRDDDPRYFVRLRTVFESASLRDSI
ncbi:hypothetical protein P692DRAFT_20762274, partial [Suillus brevipes Sb2]